MVRPRRRRLRTPGLTRTSEPGSRPLLVRLPRFRPPRPLRLRPRLRRESHPWSCGSTRYGAHSYAPPWSAPRARRLRRDRLPSSRVERIRAAATSVAAGQLGRVAAPAAGQARRPTAIVSRDMRDTRANPLGLPRARMARSPLARAGEGAAQTGRTGPTARIVHPAVAGRVVRTSTVELTGLGARFPAISAGRHGDLDSTHPRRVVATGTQSCGGRDGWLGARVARRRRRCTRLPLGELGDRRTGVDSGSDRRRPRVYRVCRSATGLG